MTHLAAAWSRFFFIPGAALLFLMPAPQSSAPAPLVLNRQAELFLQDQVWIESSSGLTLVQPQVRRHPANPLLVIDRPWEETGILNYVCVMHDSEEGLYKMWYQILSTQKPDGTPADPDDAASRSRCLYAVSKDGIRWEKPMLGLVDFRGSKQNNIAFIDPNPKPRGTPVYWVIKDYSELDPAQRYKMLYNMWDFRGRGVATAYSPDGIRWTFPQYANLLGGFDAQNIFFWDDRIGAYAGYLRARVGGKRTSARATSPDARHWSSPVTVDRNLPADPPDWEPYGPGVFKYTRARHVYVMYAAGWDARTGVFEGNLGLSRDGISWFRFRAPNFLAVQPDRWDRGGVMPIPAETAVDGQTGVYYVASDHGFHDWVGKRGVGLALFPEGGFAGWRADGEGTLTTRPVEAVDLRPSLFLHLATEGGEVRAELLDRRGAVLPGYGSAECEPLTRGGTAVQVKWKGNASLEKVIAQGPFKIRLRVKRTTLFGFRVVAPGSLKALF
jgi:hypothetical protein